MKHKSIYFFYAVNKNGLFEGFVKAETRTEARHIVKEIGDEYTICGKRIEEYNLIDEGII